MKHLRQSSAQCGEHRLIHFGGPFESFKAFMGGGAPENKEEKKQKSEPEKKPTKTPEERQRDREERERAAREEREESEKNMREIESRMYTDTGSPNANTNTNVHNNNVVINVPVAAPTNRREVAPTLSEAEDLALLQSKMQENMAVFIRNFGTAKLNMRDPQIVAAVESFKNEGAAKFNKELEQKGSRYRLSVSPVGNVGLFVYKYQSETGANFYNLTAGNITKINSLLNRANSSKNRTRPVPQVVKELNLSLRDARIVDVHFEEPITGIPGIRLVGGPSTVEGFSVTSN